MKVWKLFIALVCLLTLITDYHSADAQENLAQQVSAIFQQNCLNCHGPSGSFKEALLLDRTALIDTQVVIIGNPENSEFYKRLLGPTEKGPQMPLNLPPLSPEAIETIARWIIAGAPDWDVQHDINFMTTDTILDTIQNHLKSLDPFDRPSARYFTMTHLYNAGESPETLSDYRIALSKLINSLSWKFEITNPIPIDEAQTIFHIDLRRYEWNTTTDVWTQIEQAYPYNIAFDPETQAGLLEKLTHLQTETGSTVPFVHVDWFLATASLPPLYHDILGLPQTDRVLEAQLEVNVASNIRNAPGINVWRAGFNDSGVSSNNRVVERHTSRYGAYWKSYDFAGSVGSQNIFTHPLDFTHDGGEIIFNLPNGLQAYLLVDVNGNRLNDAPIDIVRNLAASNPTVRNGLSCIGCHTQGMKKFEDSVRVAIEQDDNPPYNKEQALRLYAKQSVLDNLVAKDTLRFQQALEKIGGPFADDASRQRFFKQHENEPIQRFHESFQSPLNASDAAAAVGLETEAFLTQIREKQSLKNLGLQTLIDVKGTVKRDAWTSNFDDVISALNTPDSILPPVVQRPERIPGAGVYIPDPNLRAAIAEALSKGSGDTITAAEMATLIHLEAMDVDIQNLIGLQHATHLEVLKINRNPVSDLSPLAGLITLKELNISWTQLSDLSPLAGLINLQHLEAWSKDNTVSDLSPLANLNNLIHLDISGSKKITDLSPLANLRKLNVLRLYDNAATDLSPLKNLVQLEMLFVEATHSVLDISPLANLTRLWFLHLANNKISDVTPLSELVALEKLYLNYNNISDVSALAGLINLEYLDIRGNPITDFSPLDALSENTNILTVEVVIPDPNLRAAIEEALGKTQNSVITAEDMATLTIVSTSDRDIKDLTGIEHAVNLEEIWIEDAHISNLAPLAGLTKLKKLDTIKTDISDISPLAGLTNLTRLNLYASRVTDISPLRSLTKLTWLGFRYVNGISDYSPLAGLTNLKHLDLFRNRTSDISMLAGLINLETLILNENNIVDVSPLASLQNLETLILNENNIIDVSPLASLHNLKTLLLNVNNIEDISPLEGIRENLEVFRWHKNPSYPQGGPKIEGPWLWLQLPKPNNSFYYSDTGVDYLAEASDRKVTEQQIATLGATAGDGIGDNLWLSGTLEPYNYNPNESDSNLDNLRRSMSIENKSSLAVIYASITLYSPRIQHTKMFIGAGEFSRKVWLNGALVYNYPHYIDNERWNSDYQDFFSITLQKGKNVLLVSHVYKYYREISFFAGFAPGTEYMVENPNVDYTFSESNIHAGDTFTLDLSTENVIDFAGWEFDIAFDPTVLEVVEVNEGDFLKTGGETTFFQKGTIDNSTGKITKLSSARLSEDGVSGTGTLLSVMFTAKTVGQTQLKLENFQLAAITGVSIPAGPHEVIITVERQLAIGDVNRDGQVNILDMVLVARHFGKTVPADSDVDLNGDGVINIQDLILVAQHLGESTATAAPSAIAIDGLELLDPAMIQAWIEQAQVKDDGSIAFRKGIANLEQLLTLFIPETTALLNNYPNPFNPETWIPYQLSEPAEVTLRIYAVNGSLIRTLALGQMPAGIYQIRPRAAYWDGKNDLGESVASGVYFYTLTAGNFTATKKMLIRK